MKYPPRIDPYVLNPEKFLAADTKKKQVGEPGNFHATITTAADGEGRFIRQSGSKGQYGHVKVTIEPNAKAKGIKVLNEIVDGAIPQEFIKPAKDGILEGLRNGVISGYPVTDVIVHLIGGSSREKDSSELAFKMAGIFAVKHALQKAKPIILP